MDLAAFTTIVAADPVLQSVPFDRFLLFLASAAAIKDDILLFQPSNHPLSVAPNVLPRCVQLFLSNACSFPINTVLKCWSSFKDLVWHDDNIQVLLRAPLSTFHDHGLPHGIAARTLYPPSPYCSAPSCSRTLKGMRMMRVQQRECVLYTLADGPLPVYSIHHYCEACEINYHHNFKVFKGERTYYGGIPDILQIGEHQFVERAVVDMWLALMDHWTSATACANFYNTSLAKSNKPPPDWSFGFTLSSEHVWSAVLLYCLLEDALEREEYLIVPHTGEQKDRFKDLILARNQRMRIEGQPEVTHFCDKCTRWIYGPDDKVVRKCSVVVTDGVCIGHPCCAQHNCQVPLKNNRDRFCPSHVHLKDICAIKSCDKQVVPGRLTCADPIHQRVESHHQEKGQSRFQLRDRLLRAREAHPTSHSANTRALSQLTALDNDEEVFDIDSSGRVTEVDEDVSTMTMTTTTTTTTTTTAHQKLQAKFTRSRTHNEQLAVAPCGMIMGRDTMFGAEGVASVAEFLKRTFRIEAIKPDHIFFDNNCSLAQHVKMDPYFDNIGLSVDVFHFKSKHKETHTFCQENCNPAAFPELIGTDGGWFFNSSVAEQTNVWIGGYHAICREMLVDKYDFFLDQMILRRNRSTRAKLEAKGSRPGNWSII